MFRQTVRLARFARVTQRVKTGKCFSKYVNKDDERNGINALDRLLLIKPAILEESDEYDYDGMHEYDDNVELDGEPDPRVRLSRKLLSLGRIYYRHIEGLPEWFTAKQAEICNNRTPAQVRRCLKDWMIKYDRASIEKYASKPLIWGEKVPRIAKIGPIMAYGPEETVAYANYFMPSRFSITTRVFNELKMVSPEFKPKRIVDFGCGPATAGAAAYNVWGSEGTSKYTGIDMSQSMIDAAKIMTRDTIPDSVFWDKSSEVIKRAEARQERFDLAVVSYSLSDFVNDPTRRAAIQIMFELLDVGGYLVVIDQGNPKGSNMTRAARQLVLDTFNNVNVDGKALCLETSTYLEVDKDAVVDEDEDEETAMKRVEYNIKNAKKIAATQKVKKDHYTSLILPAPPGYSHNEIGAYVVAPCTHDKPCPLAPGVWCSFSQKVYSGMIRKSSEEKFSYLVIQKRPKPVVAGEKKKKGAAVEVSNQPRLFKDPKNHKAIREGTAVPPVPPPVAKKPIESFGNWTIPMSAVETPPSSSSSAGSALDGRRTDPTPLEVLKRFNGLDREDVQGVVDQLIDEVDWDDYNPPLHREEYGRIVRSPIKSRGHVTMDLCAPSGHITRSILSKGNLLSVPALYVALRKTTWGGLFPVMVDDHLKSPLTIKSKGLRGPVGPPGHATDIERSPFDNDEDDDDEEEKRPIKVKKINRNAKPALTPEQVLAREDLRRRNAFTGRPVNSKTFYPEIEPIEKTHRKPFAIVDAPLPPQYNENADRAEGAGRTVGRRRGLSPLLKKASARRKSGRGEDSEDIE